MGCFPDGMRSTSDAWSPKTGEVFQIGPVPDQAHRGLKTRWCSGLDHDFLFFLSLLLSAHVERVSVFSMRDFLHFVKNL